MADWDSTLALLVKIGQSTSLIVLATMWGRKTRLGPVFRPLIGYLICDTSVYIIGVYANRVLHNNIFNFHVSTFSDVTWLTLLFIHLASGKTKNWLKMGWLLFLASAITSALWVDGLTVNMNVLSRTVGNTFLILMAFRQLSQMIHHEYLIPPFVSPVFLFCIAVAIYYSSSLAVFIGQDLPRFGWLGISVADFNARYIQNTIILFYPFLRAIHFGLLLHLIMLFPMGVTPRHALPRWLRFRLGWRPPAKNWRYRVLPPHLVG